MPSEQNVKACFLVIEFPSAKRGKKKKKVAEGNLRAQGRNRKSKGKKKKRKQVKKKLISLPQQGELKKHRTHLTCLKFYSLEQA